MDHTYWLKQSSDKPLFPELIWSRPQNRAQAGKLLVVGGNLHAFAAPAEAFAEAETAGAGTVRVILPDAAKKIVGPVLEHVEYAPSTPSGSFGRQALSELLEMSHWADGVLVAGDLGRNSETAILLEKFAVKFKGQLTLTKDAVDYVVSSPEIVSGRENTLLVLSFAQLQKLASGLGFEKAFTFDMDMLRLAGALHDFTKKLPIYIVVRHLDQTHVAASGKVASTKLQAGEDVWRVATAARAAVWWLQNPSKPFESITTSFINQ